MRSTFVGPAALSVLVLLAFARIAPASWESDPALNDLLVRSAAPAGLVSAADYATDGAGGILSIGLESTVATADYLVFNRTDAAGNRLFGDTGVRVVDISADQVLQTIQGVSDGAGGAICMLKSQRAGDTEYRYRLYRISGGGVLLSDPAGVDVAPSATGATNADGTMISDGQGGVIVAWVSDGGLFNPRVHVQRATQGLALLWGGFGFQVTGTGAGTQYEPQLASDGSGGAFVAWDDDRSGVDEVYVSRVDAAKNRIGPLNGIPIRNDSQVDRLESLAADGVGGLIVGVLDQSAELIGDVLVARFDANLGEYYNKRLQAGDGINISSLQVLGDGVGGAFAAHVEFDPITSFRRIRMQSLTPGGGVRWSGRGLVASTNYLEQLNPRMILDGVGGVIVTWRDLLTDNGADVYAQRYANDGTLRWGGDAIPVSLAGDTQHEIEILDAGSDAVYVAFRDERELSGGAVIQSVQRIHVDGYTGDPRPVITSVDDIPQDQGGALFVAWSASDRDESGAEAVSEYLLLRRPEAALASKPAGAQELASATAMSLQQAMEFASAGWEYVASIEALQLPAYGYSAPSYEDETPSSSPVTEYLVIARTADGDQFVSEPLGGLSTDDVAPAAPRALAAMALGSQAQLNWVEPLGPIGDLLEYRVYLGSTEEFAIESGSFVGSSPTTTLAAPGPGAGAWFYRVTAVDVHGNEGAPSASALLDQVTATDEPTTTTRTRLVAASPNPFNPRTEIRFDVARPGRVSLTVFDSRGRRVATLMDKHLDAGPHRVRWSPSEGGSAIASGTYFVWLVAEDQRDVLKVTLTK